MPSPTSPAAQLAAFMARYDAAIVAQAKGALAKLRRLLPNAVELVYDNYNALVIAFGASERLRDIALSVALYPKWVRLFFLHGATLADPEQRLEGNGKQVRSIRLHSADDLDDAYVKGLIKKAAAHLSFDQRRTVVRAVVAKQRPRKPKA